MLHSRIREVRRAKGMTLQQVAERSGTTAQTIGRLETGVRTLSIDWVRRIAEALDADPSELLALPGGGDIEIAGTAGADGTVSEKGTGTLSLRLSAKNPTAIRMGETAGSYSRGDVIIFDKINLSGAEDALGSDCLVTDTAGGMHMGKLVEAKKSGAIRLAPLGPSGTIRTVGKAGILARAVTLVRSLN